MTLKSVLKAMFIGIVVAALPLSGINLAAEDELRITVHGRQTHGALPWTGIDPIVISGQILAGLQTIASRQMDVTRAQSIVTIGSIHGGVRGNIIPDTVEMIGTIRTFDLEMREDLHQRIRRTVTGIAQSAGATADVEINAGATLTYNDPALTAQMMPSLKWAAGDNGLAEALPITASEDFAFYQEHIPGLYVFLGINKTGVPWGEAAGNHSPFFYVNEDALKVGVRILTSLALDYLEHSGSGD
jgi:amidohydrolase